jgi:hypothetical protein
MRVGQPLAAEVGHRVRLAPDHVVQQPEARILHRGADAKDVVIAADHPDRAVGFQQAARGGQPVAGEAVIGGKAGELVPVVVDRIDKAVVGAVQVALQLQVVGRVGEDQVDAALGQDRITSMQSPASIWSSGSAAAAGLAILVVILCLCPGVIRLLLGQR